MASIVDTNINNNKECCFIPGLQLMSLTPEEDNYDYNTEIECDTVTANWMEDSECQENLATILPLNPEECIVDKDNHIQNIDGIHLFFEELGYLTEEPEPIDPTCDYEAEAKILIEERNKTHKRHIDLSPMPSLDDTITSGISSTSSSLHQDEHIPTLNSIRSPLYIGSCFGNHSYQPSKMTAYTYAPHALNSLHTTPI
ncbi:uncharacterized protein BX663DRAFT_498488 [Cokeromyces recurvatus]|uniref:uncharacterized protein n=1 Tax=Cokeromyces recurvatus TaxID=90255 RepID=UPI002220B05D|nr:uncharacterized protein BX663DRAFT_498488 [Cokeromyces recurvatus]KAI7906008.1 hypothetical protein BX663DRAFT_498488 [Cokeromyces recurvatus]